MHALHKRVNAREQPVGWYMTGLNVDEETVALQDFFSETTSPHTAVLLLIDPTFSNDKLGIKAYLHSHLGLASEERGSMFIQIPCEARYFDAERTGLDLISMAKSQPDHTASLLSDIDNLERSILRLQDMLTKVSAYVDRVVVRI
jgi:translation initiation factor 3 subunit F